MTEWLRLRYVAETVTSNVDKRKSDDEIPVRLINYTDVYYGDRLTPDLPLMWATASASEIARHRVAAGDVLITKDSETADDIGIAAYVESSVDNLVCGYHLSRIRAHQATVEPRYLFWALTGSHARDQMNVAATGVTRFGLRADSIRDLSIRVPPLTEQRAIADYLDTETNRIDTLITKKRRMIELLEERRLALVTETVVQGHDSYASTWQRLKYFCDGLPQYGLNVPAGEYAETGTRFLRTSDINERGEIVNTQPVYIQDSIVGPSYGLVHGDLLLSRSGTLGRCLRYQSGLGRATFAGYLIRFRPNHESEPRFLEYCSQSRFFQQAIEAEAISSTISNFNAERYSNLQLPWWPLDRQRAIANHLDLETGHVDKIISEKRRSIELLAERRQALITAAVTGELPVPRVAA